MNKISKLIYFFVTFIFLTLLDKYFSNLIINNTEKLHENPIFDFVLLPNQGAAFSILQNSRIFLIAFSVFAICFILFYTIKHLSQTSGIALFFTAMMTAGIFCNMYERIFLGYVLDYIKLNFIDFPVFNISDVLINIGVIGIVIIIIKNNYFKNNETDN
ncbi:signal peptidase II [bacterium]|nr:signal peptidase II [bacterium]